MENILKPKRVTITLMVLMTMFIMLSLTTLVLGVPNEDVNDSIRELETISELELAGSDKEVIETREQRVNNMNDLVLGIKNDIQKAIDSQEYETIEEKYGYDIKAILENEVPNLQSNVVNIGIQPLQLGDTILPVDITLGTEEVSITVLYEYDSGNLTPQYVHLDSEVE